MARNLFSVEGEYLSIIHENPQEQHGLRWHWFSFPVWHQNVLTSLTDALTTHEDSGWRTHVLVPGSCDISSLSPFLRLLIHQPQCSPHIEFGTRRDQDGTVSHPSRNLALLIRC